MSLQCSSSGPQHVQSTQSTPRVIVPQTVLEQNLHLVLKCMSLFIFGGTGSALPSLAVASRGPSLVGVRELLRGWLLFFWSVVSRAQGLQELWGTG